MNQDNIVACYSGSPVPLDAHDDGPRSIALVEFHVDIGRIEVSRIDTGGYYYLHKEYYLTPFQENTEIENIMQELKNMADPHCKLDVKLRGIAAFEHSQILQIQENLQKTLAEHFASVFIRHELKSFGNLLDNPLVARFVEEVIEKNQKMSPEYRNITLMHGLKAFKKGLE